MMSCYFKVLVTVSLLLGPSPKRGHCCSRGGSEPQGIDYELDKGTSKSGANCTAYINVNIKSEVLLSSHEYQLDICDENGIVFHCGSRSLLNSGLDIKFTCTGLTPRRRFLSACLSWTDDTGNESRRILMAFDAGTPGCTDGLPLVVVVIPCIVGSLLCVIVVGFISLRVALLRRKKVHYTINQGVANEIAITEADLPDGHSPPPVPPRTAEMLDLKPNNSEIPSNNTSTTNMVVLQGIVHLPTDDDMLEYYNENGVASLRRDGHPNGDISHQHPSTVISNDLPTTNLTAIENQQHDVPPEESDIPPPIPPRPKKHTYYNTAPLVPPKGSVTPPPTIPPRSYLRPTDQEYTDTVRITKSLQPPYPGSTETLDELPESERFTIERDKLSLNEFLGHQKPPGSDGEDNTCMSTAESQDMWPPPIPRRSDLMYFVKDYNPEVFHVVHNDPIEMKDNVAYKKCV